MPRGSAARSKCTGWAAEPMRITVRYFAAFREAAGTERETLDKGEIRALLEASPAGCGVDGR